MKDGKLSEAPDFTAVTCDSKSNWPRHFRSVNHRANLGDIPFQSALEIRIVDQSENRKGAFAERARGAPRGVVRHVPNTRGSAAGLSPINARR